jgi:hypothetical protein
MAGGDNSGPSDQDVGQAANDLEALQEAAYDTSDAGRGNDAMKESDIAKDEHTSSREVSRAAHTARDDMEKESWLSRH